MNIPLYIYLALWFISLLLAANLHGKPQKNYNFWSSFITSIIITLIIWAVAIGHF